MLRFPEKKSQVASTLFRKKCSGFNRSRDPENCSRFFFSSFRIRFKSFVRACCSQQRGKKPSLIITFRWEKVIFRVETFFEWLFFVQGRKWRASCRNERPADSAVPGWTLVHAAPTPLSDFTFLKWRIKFPHFYRTVSKFSLEIVYIGDDAFLSNRDIASNEGSAQYPIRPTYPTQLSTNSS